MEHILKRDSRPTVSYSATVSTGTQLFHICCWLYLVAFFILPDGFGFRLGFLFSAKRIMMFICWGAILFSRERLNKFLTEVKKHALVNSFVILFLFVRFYTAVYRTDINTLANDFLDAVLVFYLFLYILKYEITTEQFLKFIRVTLWVLCIEGVFEYVTHVNLFGLINFAGDAWGATNIRGGTNRISGNCHHAIHYGMYVSILFFLSCLNLKKNRLYLFEHPLLFLLATICIFLSGSRAPLGIYMLCCFLICLCSGKNERRKSFLILGTVLSVFTLFVMAVYNTPVGRQIMYMLAAMYDAIFDTEYALLYNPQVLRWSTEYRDALKKVFDLWYFNKLVGRGISYQLSVVIDGYWLQSCDNSYVMTYIQFAYPGLIVLISHFILLCGRAVRGWVQSRQKLFAGLLIIFVCYFINIWYVAFMGTYMYIWMLFALLCIEFQKNREDNGSNDLCKTKL